MKNQINLLHKEFKPKFVWVCSEHFLLLIAITLIICIAAYMAGISYKNSHQEKLDGLKQQLASSQVTTDELTGSVEQRISDPVLKNQLESFTKKSQAKSVLVSHVRELSTVKQRSFSSLLDSLAQSSSNDLWLTGFDFKSNNINLHGKLANPNALPKWISQLSDTDFFKGQEFGQASVEKIQDDLTFKLTSMVKNEQLVFANNVKPNIDVEQRP